jgi:hypothetical protein
MLVKFLRQSPKCTASSGGEGRQLLATTNGCFAYQSRALISGQRFMKDGVTGVPTDDVANELDFF